MGINGISNINSEEYKIKEQQAIEEVVNDVEEEVVEETSTPSFADDFEVTNENELVEFNDDVESKVQDTIEDKVEDKVEDKKEEVKKEIKEEKTEKTVEETKKEIITFSEFASLIKSDSGLNKLAKEKGIGALFDKLDTDHSGEISSSELKTAGIKDNDISKINTVDLEKYLSDSFKAQIAKTKETKKAESKPKETEKATSTNSGGSISGSYGSGSVGGSYGGYSSPSNVNDSMQDVNANKSIDEQIKDLKTQKTEENNKLNEKNKELSAVQSGTDSEIEGKQKAVEDAKTKYNEAMKKENPKVKNLKEQQDAKEKEIQTDDKNIANAENEITKSEQEKFNQESEISNLESNLSAYESTLSSLTVPEGADENTKKAIETKKQEVESKIDELKGQIDDAKGKLQKTEDHLKAIKDDLKHYKENKRNHEKARDEIIKQIEANCSKETKIALENYTKAQEDLEKTKSEKADKIQKEIDASKTKITELDAKINELQTQKIQQENKPNTLNGTFNFEGEEYNCLLSSDEMKKLVEQAAQGGAGTKYGKNDKCLSIAETYGMWMTGDSNTSYANSGNYHDATAYKVYNTEDKNALLAKVKEELDNGKPCVLHVNGSGRGRHYVTVVGYKSSASGQLKEEDLLLWDSYDSSIRGCGNGSGKRRHMITGWSTGRTGKDGYGWQVYTRK